MLMVIDPWVDQYNRLRIWLFRLDIPEEYIDRPKWIEKHIYDFKYNVPEHEFFYTIDLFNQVHDKHLKKEI